MSENYVSTKVIEMGSCAFRQWKAMSHCSRIHGYQLTAKFWFTAKALDERQWIFDFGALDELKKQLTDTFDHTLVVDAADPELDTFVELNNRGVVDLRIFPEGVGIERTAEYCWKLADTFVRKVSNDRVRCVQVEVFEHPKNSAIYKVES